MSKKRKSSRKPQPPAKPVVKPRTEIHATKRSAPAPAIIPPASVAPVSPVAKTAEAHNASLPFWARMPFAVMDFWMSRTAREGSKS
jgi:hypothetical protein